MEECVGKNRMLEPEIKALVLNHLYKNWKLDGNSCVINEFSIENFARRVDLAVADKDQFIAIEIKSEADNLQRLEGQTEKYLEYFDKVIVVADPKHIERILAIVPRNVEVWMVSESKIKIEQRGRFKKIKNRVKLMKLMKSNELFKLARSLGFQPESKKRNCSEKVLQNAKLGDIRFGALKNIKERFFRSYSEFLKNTATSEIKPSHIQFLSPYRESRLALAKVQKNQKILWDSWTQKVSEDSNLIGMTKISGQRPFGVVPKEVEELIAV